LELAKLENEAITKSLSENANITVAELKKLAELIGRPKDSIKTKLSDCKLVPLSKATYGGKGKTSEQDDQLKATYKAYGNDYKKLTVVATGRIWKVVIQNFDKKKKTRFETVQLKRSETSEEFVVDQREHIIEKNHNISLNGREI
jgi:hypothetical protein